MSLTVIDTVLPATSAEAIEALESVEAHLEALPQVDIVTTHTLHDGVYTRTVNVPAGVFVVGVTIKIPTTFILSGDATVIVGNGSRRLTGYHVLTGAAMRKQAALAHSDTSFTMLFRTDAKTIEEAEAEFTDEPDRLLSRRSDNILTQGDTICQALQ